MNLVKRLLKMLLLIFAFSNTYDFGVINVENMAFRYSDIAKCVPEENRPTNGPVCRR